ncbi:MAG: NADP oxidoreductase [Chloroflexota bacterium]
MVDNKAFPEMADITLVEGAVSSREDLEKIQKVRAHTKTLVSLGDCAVTANVPGMRNRFKVDAVYDRAYFENAARNQQIPLEVVPPLLPKSVPVHQVVTVDVFVPGCPPSADTIFYTLTELLAGRTPDLQSRTRFGS